MPIYCFSPNDDRPLPGPLPNCWTYVTVSQYSPRLVESSRAIAMQPYRSILPFGQHVQFEANA